MEMKSTVQGLKINLHWTLLKQIFISLFIPEEHFELKHKRLIQSLILAFSHVSMIMCWRVVIKHFCKIIGCCCCIGDCELHQRRSAVSGGTCYNHVFTERKFETTPVTHSGA